MVKHKLLVMVGAILVLLTMVTVPGCVSESTHDALKAEYESLMAQFEEFLDSHTDLQQSYD